MLPLTVRKMITREVELEQMRRSESSTRGSNSIGEQSSERATSSKPPAPVTDLKSSAKAFILPELSGMLRVCVGSRWRLGLTRSLLNQRSNSP